jgi:hypothetical protein
MRLNLALHFTLRRQNNLQYTCNGLFAYSKPMQVFVSNVLATAGYHFNPGQLAFVCWLVAINLLIW